jgi:hypothetical protein
VLVLVDNLDGTILYVSRTKMMIRAFSSINNATFLYFAMIYVDAMQAINGQFMLCMCHKIPWKPEKLSSVVGTPFLTMIEKSTRF